MTDDPRTLIERYCRKGDQEAFTSFYRQHADRLWRFLRARGASADAAYDLVSESFVKFLPAICRDTRAPLGLLYRIAVNLQIDLWRRDQAARAAYAAEPPASTGPAADEREFVRRLVARLEPAEQNLVLMRYWIGLTHREIAMALDMPEGSVRRRAAEALGRLRDLWRENGND